MSLSVGIVGLPNVGKSSLFQALTQKEVEVANYPFATIDPNVGIVKVPDERLDKLASLFNSESVVPAIVEFVDIAGLVRGAAQGEGLGNQFLTHIREVQAICHVVRTFEHGDISHVDTTVEPLRDIETVETELLLKDLETLEKRLNTLQKDVRAGDKTARIQEEALTLLKSWFDQGKTAREFLIEYPDREPLIRDSFFLSSKPVIFLLNSNTPFVDPKVLEALEQRQAPFVVMSIKEELEAAQLSPEEAALLGHVPKLPQLIRAAYELLGLITFLTAGEKETRAWTIRKGSTAPQAAGEIHTDFEKNFIRAQVIPWDKLLEAGSYAAASLKGWVRTEGKEYVVRDGDVLEIKHG